MPTSIRSFIRHVPNEWLRQLMAHSGMSNRDIAAIDWEQKKDKRIAAVISALETVAAETRDRFQSYVDQVDQFREDHGVRALRSVVLREEMDHTTFDRLEDARICAIWVLVHSVPAFDDALAANYAEQHSLGRLWSGFAIEQGHDGQFRLDPTRQEEFEDKAKAILPSDALSGRIRIEWFKRVLLDPIGGEERMCIQATIHQERRPQIESEFTREGELQPVVRRPVYEGAIVFDETRATLDVIARGGKSIRTRLAQSFADTLIESEIQTRAIEQRELDLSQLTREQSFDLRAEDRIIAVRVEQLTLLGPHGSGFAVTLRLGAKSAEDNSVYKIAAQAFGSRSPLTLPGWSVVAAAVRVVFEPEEGRRQPKRALVELKLPNRTNLRDRTEEHRLIAHELLERWGLYKQTDEQ